MDEPTSSLTSHEVSQLFSLIERLASRGVAIVYITHRLDEVFRIGRRITVLRDGGYVGDISRADATHDKIVQMMVGRDLSGAFFPERTSKRGGEPVLEVTNLLVPGTGAGVSFTALKGEILGFAGLVGAGRTELMQTIFGVTPALAGTMLLEGKPYAPETPRDAIERGVLLAPEDRKRHGLVLPMNIAENTSLPNVARYARFGWLDRVTEKRVAEAEMKRMRTKAFGIAQKVVNLSGGNQQKVVLGKWLAMNPRVLILDEPTRGIDVGAKAEIYRHMAQLAADGITVLMVSSDMEEILGMSDRVVVMHEKRLRGILPREGLTQQQIATLMTGGKGAVAA